MQHYRHCALDIKPMERATSLDRARGCSFEHLDEARRSPVSSGNEQWTSSSAAYLRPQTGATTDVWAHEAAAHGSIGTQRLLIAALATPPPFVRALLNLTVGQEALLRRRLVLSDGRPVELVDSWFPAEIAAGTQLAELRKIRGGTPTLLAALGHRIAEVTEDVESRLASTDEQTHLHLGPHEPVLVLTRLSRNQHGAPIEASVMVTPGSERRLRYEMKVD
jgi:DNA-binding GntR family transcriptional regulator